MFKRSFVCFCVLFIGSLFVINFAYALSIGFDPDAQTVSQTDLATFNIKVEGLHDPGNEETTMIYGYYISIIYDADVLSFINEPNNLSNSLGDISIDLRDNSGSAVNSTIDEYKIGTIDLFWYANEDSLSIPEPTQPDPLFLSTLKFEAIGEEGATSMLMVDDFFLYVDSSYEYSICYEDIDEIVNGSITISASQSVPEPATFLLLGTLLFGFVVFKRKEA